MRAAVLTVLAGAAYAVPAAPAAAAACAPGAGVTVVVDFGSLGGTSRQCAAGDPTSGLAALRAAGFTPTRAAQEPGYFVCRINGKPANDPCQRTSRTDAYWSYWHAKPGGSWTYSSTGPADDDPQPGTVDGWAFGAGKPPSSPPPAAASAPSPAPTSARSSPPPVSTPAVSALSSRPPAPAPAVASSAPSAWPTTSTTPSPSPSLDEAVSAPTDDLADPPLPRRGGVSGPIVAAVLVSLLLAVAGGTSLRRRRDGS